MSRVYRVEWQQTWSASRVLLTTMAAVWLLSAFLGPYFHDCFALSVGGLRRGCIWQLLTYSLMHVDLWHFLGNGIILFFIGRIVERQYGRRVLYGLFFLSSLTGALVWFCVNFHHPWRFLLGASAGCLGVFTFFCLALRDQPLTFLLFFIVPVRLRPRTLLAITIGLEVLGFLFQELANHGAIANSAHLGGFLGGYLGYLLGCQHLNVRNIFQKYRNIFRQKATTQSTSYKIYITKDEKQRQEVDRILDKINASGFQSLTSEEREFLESTKQLMHR